jgi:predicted Zn-dependent protease with MMP-like domain
MPLRRRGGLARRHPERRVALPEEPGHRPFEELVEHALDNLPAPFAALLDSVAIVIEDEPSTEEARRSASAQGLYGLYEGTPLIAYAADQVPFPNKITLYRLALEEDFPDPDELADEVRRTVIHELAHHAGFDDDRLRAMNFE